jgi:hypothetical protein
MSHEPIEVASISWIDDGSVPKVGFWFVAGALTSWPRRVIMGLVGTSNPEPPTKLTSVAAFASSKQYRALLACTLRDRAARKISDLVVDPGYTPPFDKSKLDTRLRDVAPIPNDTAFYAGEKSAVSGAVTGKLHPCSTLSVPRGGEVLVSALIKFRAGKHTDEIGIKNANSPVHVPWVWCEYALVARSSGLLLLCNGSVFPSHAWYVNGKQVAKAMQAQVTVSDHDPALSTGQPAAYIASPAVADKSAGSVFGHQYTLAAGEQTNVDLSPSVK